MKYIGNVKILNGPKVAFLCSDKYSSKSVLLAYDWAEEMKKSETCVISGFQSKVEKDVLDILLKGDSPIIIALARSIYKSAPKKYADAVREGRLLIISQFDDGLSIPTKQQAYARNIKIIELADELVIGHINPGGMIDSIVKETNKPIIILDKLI